MKQHDGILSIKYIVKITATMYIISLFTFTYNSNLFFINRIFLFLLVILVLILVLAKQKLKIETVLSNTYPFIILLVINNLWAVDTEVSINRTVGVLYYMAGAFIIYLLTHNNILSLKNIKNAAIISILLLTFTSNYEYIFLNITRGAGIVENPNIFGMNIIYLSLIVWGVDNFYGNKSKITTLFLLGIILNALIISGGRKVLLISIPVVLFMLLFNGLRITKRNILKLTTAAFIILSILIYLISDENLQNGFRSISMNINAIERLLDENNVSSSIRQSMISIGIQLFRNSPLIGYGLDNFRVVSSIGTYSHNNYIEILVSFGVIGFIIYYFLYLKVVHYSNKVRKKTGNPDLLIFTVFCISLLLIIEFAMVKINEPTIWFLLIMLILLNGGIQNNKSEVRLPTTEFY